MTRIRSTNELILSALDYYRISLPLLDTKPGTVARDLLIDGPSIQLSRLYDELNRLSSLQSLRLAIGSDLDRLAQNFGAIRKTGSKSSGPALLTFSTLDSDVAITKGDIVTAKNGASFVALNSLVVATVRANEYRAVAARYQSDLDYVGITDQFAVSIVVESTATGSQGNISRYSINNTSISGVSNITNTSPFGGGTSSEDDASFRSRVLSVFSGANTGTALGYRNAVLADVSVIDALVIEPGDTLMVRDGTEISTAEDGTVTIISEGTGGRVDIYVFGTRLQEVIDSYIYRDLSNTGDPTDIDNDHVLGQISGDENKTVTRKRLDNIASGVLPSQPANNIIDVSGSLSGTNFVTKSVDTLGRVTGNYELVRDTGVYSGSPWGFDRLRWLDDNIRDLQEDKTKGLFNGQDPLNFTDLTEVKTVTQNRSVVNENSQVTASNRSSIQLAHFPVSGVTRVFNVTTGERYVVTNQNPDGDGTINENGRIIISGKSLPAVSDILQVDYTWVFTFDPYFDYDNRTTSSNPRTVQDSIDWGFSNAVRRERVTLIAAGSFLTATVSHPVSTVVSVNLFTEEAASISLISNRLGITVGTSVTGVISIVRASDGAELYNTFKSDGTFSEFTIFFPTDTPGNINDDVIVVYNGEDVFNTATPGNSSASVISIVPSATAVAGSLVEVSYLANISSILPATSLSSLPAIRSANAFDTNTSVSVGSQPTTYIFDGLGDIVSNLRQAPSNLGLTISGSISPGIITVTGTTVTSIIDTVFTATVAGLTQDLSSAIKKHLGLSSNEAIPSNISIARLVKLEEVVTNSAFDVLDIVTNFDIKGYELRDNQLVIEESIKNTTLTSTQVTLPTTADNSAASINIGDRLRARFYIAKSSDTENVAFSKSGTLFTNKRFSLINVISISSGFTSAASASATLTVTNLNQPEVRSRYSAFYDYVGPKSNERITIRYNFDQIIADSTLSVENTRPINADVLVKSAVPILVDVSIKIVVTNEFINSSAIVAQNVRDAVTTAVNARQLGTVIDSSDLINTSYTINGVDRARTIFFNKTGSTGSVLSIESGKNEYIQANTITITVETR